VSRGGEEPKEGKNEPEGKNQRGKRGKECKPRQKKPQPGEAGVRNLAVEASNWEGKFKEGGNEQDGRSGPAPRGVLSEHSSADVSTKKGNENSWTKKAPSNRTKGVQKGPQVRSRRKKGGAKGSKKFRGEKKSSVNLSPPGGPAWPPPDMSRRRKSEKGGGEGSIQCALETFVPVTTTTRKKGGGRRGTDSRDVEGLRALRNAGDN